MSLNLKVFLIMSTLLAALAGAHWWMLRAFSMDLHESVDQVAVTVGRDLVQRISTMPQVLDLSTLKKLDGDLLSLQDLDLNPREDEATTRNRFKFVHRLQDSPQQAQDPGTRTSTTVEIHTIGDEKNATMNVIAMEIEDEILSVPSDPGKTMRYLILKSADDEQRIEIPREPVSQPLSQLTARLNAGTLATFAMGLLLAALLSYRVTRPLGRLARAAERIGQGERGIMLSGPFQNDEVGTTMKAFNHMSGRLKEHEARALRYKDQEQLSELGEIARGLAHTIRNPLNALGLSIDQLSEEEISPEHKRELASTARHQIRRIDQWVRSFLALASQGAARAQPVDVMHLVQDVVLEILQDPTPKARVAVQGESLTIQGVEGELRAVIQALLVNAVEATPPDREIRVQVRTESDDVLIEVEDEGPGLPDAVRSRIFSPHTTTKPQGSGMGLFLAHRIINSRYCGGIRIQDRQPHGTTVVIRLPQEGGFHD